MKSHRPALSLTLLLITLFLGISSNAYAANFDYDLYQQFLDRYAHPNQNIAGVVLTAMDYRKVFDEKDQADSPYRLLLEHFSSYDLTALTSRNEKLAFWINAYNLGAVKMIIDHFPLDSIRSRKINFFKNPWGIKIVNIGGKDYSLGHIEHHILIDKLAEPMTHFAIVCASISCPDLSTEVYHPASLDKQLKQQASLFLLNREKGLKIDRERGIVFFSKIFKFDRKTFPDGAVSAIDLISPFLPGEDRSYIENRKFEVKYLNYNWNLNSAAKGD